MIGYAFIGDRYYEGANLESIFVEICIFSISYGKIDCGCGDRRYFVGEFVS